MPAEPLAAILPGLYVVAVAFALRELLARWYPVPPRWVLAAFVVLVLALLHPSLLGGRVQLPLHLLTGAPPFERLELPDPPPNELQYDLVLEVAPYEIATRRRLAAGEWPLWNPRVGTGMPMLADPQAHAHWLQPLALPSLVVPAAWSFGVVAACRLLAALVFTFLLLRLFGCGQGPALFGSIAYGFGAFLVLWLGWPHANSAALLPFLLFALTLTAERGARRDWALLAVAAFAVLLAGHPETAFHVTLTGAGAALALLARADPGRRRSLLARWLGTAAVALACAAPALLPSLEHLPETHRAELVERRNARLAEEDPLAGWRTADARRQAVRDAARRLGPAVAPNALGNDALGPFWGEGSVYLSATGFAGTLTLVLALAGLSVRGRRFPLEWGIAWVGLPLVVVVLARPPGLAHLFAAVPGLDRSADHHARVTLLLGFFLAVLAAFTLERWRRREGVGRTALAAGYVIAVGATLGAYLLFAPQDPETLTELRRSSMAIQTAVPLLGIGLLLALGRRARGRSVAAGVLGLLAFAEAAFFAAPANPAGPRSLFYPESAAVGFLREHAGGGRVAGLGDVLPPNVPSVYGLSDPRVSNPSKPWRHAAVVAPLTRSVREMTDVYSEPEHPLYRLLGVRYLLVRNRFPLEPRLRRVYQGEELSVYEHPDPLPLVFLPGSAVRRDGDALRWMRGNPDFRRRALAERIPGGATAWRSRRPEASTTVLVRRTDTRITVRALLVEPRLLASSVHQDGHWHVLVRGRRLPALVTNTAFAGAWLGAGEHTVELLYRPASFVLGCLLAAVALAAGLAWWVPPPARIRRTAPGRRRWPPSPTPSGGAPGPGASASAP